MYKDQFKPATVEIKYFFSQMHLWYLTGDFDK